GLGGVVFVVIGDELHPVRLSADGDPARGVHPFRPDLAAVEPRFAPGRDRPGQRREKADLQHLVLREDGPGQDAAHNTRTRRRSGRAEEFATAHAAPAKAGKHGHLRVGVPPDDGHFIYFVNFIRWQIGFSVNIFYARERVLPPSEEGSAQPEQGRRLRGTGREDPAEYRAGPMRERGGYPRRKARGARWCGPARPIPSPAPVPPPPVPDRCAG